LLSYRICLLAFVAPSCHKGCQKLAAISTSQLKFYATRLEIISNIWRAR